MTAYNDIGSGTPSTVLQFTTSTYQPDVPTSVTTTESADGLSVDIEWTVGSANGVPISAYKILINTAGSTYVDATTYCSQSNATMSTTPKCTITMAQLATLGLVYDQTVKAKVSAYNTNGWSAESTPNSSGAQVNTVPEQMDEPTSSSLDHDSVQITFTALTTA